MADILEVAMSSGSFKTLTKAVSTAGLTETLKGKGPFTVFAPSDEAFAKLPTSTVDALLKDPSRLKSVLNYHIVQGRPDLKKTTSVRTLEGQNLKIDNGDGRIRVNGVRVTQPSIEASNGVIHTIDRVIMPE
jgi:uncharacterized surface protein with fasciclin (FAS1) repeats